MSQIDDITPDPLYWIARHESFPTWMEVYREQLAAAKPEPWTDPSPLARDAAIVMAKQLSKKSRGRA